MKLADLEMIDNPGKGIQPKYPGEPYAAVNFSGRFRSTYLSKVAIDLLDVRGNESVRFAKHDSRFYMYRCEFGQKGSYLVTRGSDGHGAYVASGRAASKGLTSGEYMLSGPTHVDGIDLFELVPIEEYRERQKDQAA